MDLLIDDTIAALASPPGAALRSVIRISGDGTRDLIAFVFEPADPDGQMSVSGAQRYSGRLRLASLRTPVPADLYFWPNRSSYTGQPSAELHLIGSPPIVEAVLGELYRQGARPARPGEFTMRAFLSGKIDLTQAEAVHGVIEASEQRELDRALQQLAGGISGQIARLHNDLVELLADLEAGLDFVEEDIEFVSQDDVHRRLTASRSDLVNLLDSATGRMVSRGNMHVLLAGLPNAGKSTLFNALLERDAALVSAQRGTTRDYLQADLNWGDMTVELIDTAGWEFPTSGLSAAAQTARDDQIQRANLIVWCTAADLDTDTLQQDDRLLEALRSAGHRVLRIQTKCDRSVTTAFDAEAVLSAVSGQGLADFRMAVCEAVNQRESVGNGLLGTTAARCRRSLEDAAETLQRAADAVATQLGDDLVAAEIRAALEPLGEIVGTVYTDDILGRIFSKFCIGK